MQFWLFQIFAGSYPLISAGIFPLYQHLIIQTYSFDYITSNGKHRVTKHPMDKLWIALECRFLSVDHDPEESRSLFSSMIRNMKAIAVKGFDRSNIKFVKASITQPFRLGSSSQSMKYEDIYISEKSTNSAFPRFKRPIYVECPQSTSVRDIIKVENSLNRFLYMHFLSRYGCKNQISCGLCGSFEQKRGLLY